ncbi:lytic transglycosylase domain-containing protein [Streptomyces sp. NPDC057909]|uniref:lytic transglycosylase domain-containing protein n=1 Tax=Streptomyces sp. NPDC057909 TaxID=3346277 RepID=UPI0036E1A5A9
MLAASLSTAAVVGNPTAAGAGESQPTPDSPQTQDRGNARLELPDLAFNPPVPPEAPKGTTGIPGTALDAYKRAATSVAAALPGCHLTWELVAGIGRVESVHASGYGLRTDGSTEKPIRGPRLDGKQFALIKDTDGGRWDGDAEFDRAIGPTQFIPSAWARWGADGNGDGQRDPNNIYDATLGTGLYLCAGDRDLSKAEDLDKAVLSYNHSREYVNTVLGWMRTYQQGGVAAVPNPPTLTNPVPETPATAIVPTPTPVTPPTTPAKPSTPSKLAKPGKPATPGTPSKPTSPLATVNTLQRIGSTTLAAQVTSEFATRPQVLAGKSDSKPAAGEAVLFEIIGDTAARFASGQTAAVVNTGANGLATAPVISAGDHPGTFAVRATIPLRDKVAPVAFAAIVKPAAPAPVADLLARTDDKPLETVAGTSFTEPVAILSTAKGKAVAGTVLTATMITKNETGGPVPAETGPHFKDKDGNPRRTLTLTPTGADGKLLLPEIFTDDKPGTYTLRLTTPENVTLEVTLTVTRRSSTPRGVVTLSGV